MNDIYTIAEFGRIRQGSGGGCTLTDLVAPQDLWAELEAYAANAEEAGDKAVLRWHGQANGKPCLRVENHIGMLATPAGMLEILPKLARSSSLGVAGQPEKLRSVIQHMLATVPDLPFRETGIAPQGRQDGTLFEWFIARFLRKVLQAVRCGIRSSYETLEDNLPFLRGRLVLSQHLRRSVADASRLYVRFDEFTPNRPENRLIHAALRKVLAVSRDQENRRLARELAAAFADVPPSSDQASDVAAWKLERGASHYEGLREWCVALLTPYSPTPTQGDLAFESFLFPAEKLFEQYVAERFRQALGGQPKDGPLVSLYLQNQDRALFSGDSRGPFGRKYGMRPDIILQRRRGDSDIGHDVLICDTKWKLYEAGERNLGVSQADLYQMFAYAHYWRRKGKQDRVELAIVSPMSSALTTITGPHSFNDGSESTIHLWMIPYDLLNHFGSIPVAQGFLPTGSLVHDVVGWHQEMFAQTTSAWHFC